MYKSVIDIFPDVPPSTLETLRQMADTAFDNRAGKISNTSNIPYRLEYSGGEPEYSCLEIGMLKLKRRPDFLSCLEAWKWVDEADPDENCDLLHLFTKKATREA